MDGGVEVWKNRIKNNVRLAVMEPPSLASLQPSAGFASLLPRLLVHNIRLVLIVPVVMRLGRYTGTQSLPRVWVTHT